MRTCAWCKTGDTVPLADRVTCLNCGKFTSFTGTKVKTGRVRAAYHIESH